MTNEPLERPTLADEERRFVERLDAAFAPRPLSAARRAELDARLRSRIERPRWRPMLLAGTTAVAVALIVGFGLSALRSAPVAPAGIGVARIDPAAAQAWEQLLLFGDPGETDLDTDDAVGPLPSEYAAIDSLFFGG